MKPHLVRWHKDLGAKGLVVLDVDDGEQDSLDDLKKEVADHQFPFAVLWDKGGKNAAAMGVEGYPHAFLVAADGNVVWEGTPLANKAEQYDKLIQAELDKIKK